MPDKSFPMRVLVRTTMLVLGMVGLLAPAVPRAGASLGGQAAQSARAVAATPPVLLAGGRAGRDGQAGDRFPRRGSSASLQGGSSADRYGGATGDRRGMARAEAREAQKAAGNGPRKGASRADRDERLREERERKAEQRGEGGGEGAGGVLGGLGRAPKN